jgi:hypothetical protein
MNGSKHYQLLLPRDLFTKSPLLSAHTSNVALNNLSLPYCISYKLQ